MNTQEKTIKKQVGKPVAQRLFENRRKTLVFAANLSPKRVCAADIADLTETSLRTAQRTLQDLADWGYLESDDSHPKGYWLSFEKSVELLF